MKQIFFVLFVLNFSISFSQPDEINKYIDYSKEYVETVDKYYQFLTKDLQEGDLSLTAYFHFDIGKVIEKSGDHTRKYYYYKNQLFSVYDSKLNKQLFFNGDYKNASKKMYEFFSNKADEYKLKFDPYYVKTDLNINEIFKFNPRRRSQSYSAKTSRKMLNTIDCIIKENKSFEVKELRVFYASQGLDVEQVIKSCELTSKIKQVVTGNYSLAIRILLLDKENNKLLYLPEIIF